MKRALDTNILVLSHIAAAPGHAEVRSYVLTQLADDHVTLVVTPLVLHEFVHVVTDPRRFAPPLSMSEALAIARLYVGHTNVECLALDRSAIVRAFGLMEQHRLGRKRIADTLFASVLLENDVRELITCNPNDFAVFDAFDLIDPTVR